MNAWSVVPVLRGEHVVLEPLALSHVPGLQAAVVDGELWKLTYTTVPTPGDMLAFVESAIADRASGIGFPFAVLDASGTVVGSTRFGHMARAHRRVEIGWTWYAARAQRTAVNTEAKLLLLRHAFEAMDCICVQFMTHHSNEASRAAIARLGAKQDGVLRSHQIMPDGSIRDTVAFSILAAEWPAVKHNLQERLRRGAQEQGNGEATHG